jgi:REP element-mobilizing transposase RayT
MTDGGYKIRNKKEIHFVTFAVVEWVDVFTRKEYRDIIMESLKFCQKEKGLLLHGWCIMSNHIHLIASAKNENLSEILRDFKKFTSKQMPLLKMKRKAGKSGCLQFSKPMLKRTVIM